MIPKKNANALKNQKTFFMTTFSTFFTTSALHCRLVIPIPVSMSRIAPKKRVVHAQTAMRFFTVPRAFDSSSASKIKSMPL